MHGVALPHQGRSCPAVAWHGDSAMRKNAALAAAAKNCCRRPVGGLRGGSPYRRPLWRASLRMRMLPSNMPIITLHLHGS